MQQNSKFQHYYQSFCDYLLKIGRMDEEQAVLEQLTLNDFKKWSSTAFKTFNNYPTIMNNKCDHHFSVNSTGCSGEFHVIFQHFQNLKNLILNILKEKLTIFCRMGSFSLEIV